MSFTIAQIVRQGYGSAGSGDSWLAVNDRDPFTPYRTVNLYHYGHRMLCWQEWIGGEYDGAIVVQWASLGKGSVSDQNGMNAAFKILGIDWYYSRVGGAEIRGALGPVVLDTDIDMRVR